MIIDRGQFTQFIQCTIMYGKVSRQKLPKLPKLIGFLMSCLSKGRPSDE